MQKGKEVTKFVVKLVISVSLIAYIFTTQIDLSDLIDLLSQTRIFWLLTGLAAIILSNFLGSYQWHMILNETDVKLPYRKSFKYYHTGLFFNNFLLSFIGGDVVRVYDISKTSGKSPAALSTVFLDRLVGLSMLSFFALFFAVISGEFIKTKIIFLSSFGFFLILLFMLLFFFFKRFAKKFQGFGEKILPGMFHKGAHDIYNNIYHFKKKKFILFKIFCVSFIVQILRIMVHYFAALSIGISVNFVYFFIMIPIILLVIIIPISIGGLGVREQTAVILFSKIGITGPEAVLMELLAYIIGIVSSLPGGVMFLISRERKK
ncbi:lysylphosphatidylglycerol synthase transmembrane domain-containing protein [candidate division KSB1 bacterium]